MAGLGAGTFEIDIDVTPRRCRIDGRDGVLAVSATAPEIVLGECDPAVEEE